MIAADKVPFVSDCSLRRVITCGGRARVSEVLHYFSYCVWSVYLSVWNDSTRKILVLYRTNIFTEEKTLSIVKKLSEDRRFRGRDSHRTSEYKSRALPLDQPVRQETVLELISMKQGLRVCAGGFVWLRQGQVTDSCEHYNELSGSVKAWKY